MTSMNMDNMQNEYTQGAIYYWSTGPCPVFPSSSQLRSVPDGPAKKTDSRDMALEEFKTRIADVIRPEDDEYQLKKWLKARNFEVDKAETMYRESLVYRTRMKCDTLYEEYEPPKVLVDYYPGGFCGFDKEGSPVKVELFGHMDMKGLMYSCKKHDLERAKLYDCEKIKHLCKEQSAKLDKLVDGVTIIFDMENVSSKWFWRPAINMYLHLVKILEDNYPEYVKRLMVVNAPSIFPLLWKISRHLVSEDMKKKIHVLGSNYAETLKQYIDADQIPAYLGGTLTDSDGNERCITKVKPGGEIPESYYLTENIDLSNMKQRNVRQGGQYVVDVTVRKAGAVLKWEFKTQSNDIAFGVNYQATPQSDPEVLIKQTRVNSHMIPEDGSLLCEKVGIYKVVFDNSFSWARSKDLFYNVEVIANELDNATQDDINMVTGGAYEKITMGVQNTHL